MKARAKAGHKPRTKKTPEPKIIHTTARARELAREAADRYFTALAAEVPFDNAPGDVDLITACCAIEDALVAHDPRPEFASEHAKHAGYLLGVEIGRRMAGGVR